MEKNNNQRNENRNDHERHYKSEHMMIALEMKKKNEINKQEQRVSKTKKNWLQETERKREEDLGKKGNIRYVRVNTK
jgi:hypothetical protein